MILEHRRPRRLRGVIFDMDGVLLDTMSQWSSLAFNYLRENGIEPRADLNDVIGSFSVRGAIEYLIAEYGLPRSFDEALSDIRARLERLYRYEAIMKEGADRTLTTLRRAECPIALATATSSALARSALTRHRLLDYFTAIKSCRDEDIHASKSHPAVYDAARSCIGSERRETAVVEDALYALETAKDAGYFVIAFEDYYERHNKSKIQELADVYVSNHQELSEWFSSYFSSANR
ncbi:MAG: HAD family phosphatase [Planctomycetia bacterium]|nr:HAD family phosphatase [Planctomycetia bacterium]